MRTLLRAGLWLALATASPALAGEPAVALPPVVVPVPEPAPSPRSLEGVDPSGARTVIQVSDHRGEAKESAELVAGAPGVSLQDSGGLGQVKFISMRGASTNGVLVLLDGVPLQGAGGLVDLGRLPAAIVDRFEVLRGAAGARLGGGGLGGALNIVTRAPSAGPGVAGEVTYGSFASWTGQLAATGALLGGAGLLLVHGAASQGDFPYLYDEAPALEGNLLTPRVRENNDALLGGALARYHKELPSGLSLDALGELSAGRRGLPGTVRNPTPDAREDSRRALVQLLVKKRLASGGEVAVRGFARADALDLRGGYFTTPLAQTQRVVGGELSASLPLGDWQGLTGSVEASQEALAGVGVDLAWMKLSAQLMDELFLFGGVLTLAPSVRVESVGPFALFSPKLGVTVALSDALALRLNVGQAHRAPSFLELYVAQGQLLPNPSLRPERALGADATVAVTSPNGALSATAFYSLYEDLITYEYYPPSLVKPFNFAAAQTYGAEVEARFSVSAWATASAAYTLLFSQNLRDDPRYYLQELPYRPRHTLAARLAAGPAWARARAEVVLRSASATNRAGTPRLPGHAQLNLGVSCEPPQVSGVSLALQIKNALDAQGTDLTDYALPGRSAFLTLSVAMDFPTERAAPPP